MHRIALPCSVLEPERDIVLDPLHHELGGRILEHEAHPRRDADRAKGERVLAIQLERPRDRGRDLTWDQPGDGECERALAGAGRPDEQEDRARLELELDVGDGRMVGPGVGDREIACPERDRGQSGNPSSTPARLSARWSATEPPATSTTAEIAIATPRAIWMSGSTVL